MLWRAHHYRKVLAWKHPVHVRVRRRCMNDMLVRDVKKQWKAVRNLYAVSGGKMDDREILSYLSMLGTLTTEGATGLSVEKDRKRVVSEGGLTAIVRHSTHPLPSVRHAACRCLLNIGMSPILRVTCLRAGATSAVNWLLDSDNLDDRRAALEVLDVLVEAVAYVPDKIRRCLRDPRALAPARPTHGERAADIAQREAEEMAEHLKGLQAKLQAAKDVFRDDGELAAEAAEAEAEAEAQAAAEAAAEEAAAEAAEAEKISEARLQRDMKAKVKRRKCERCKELRQCYQDESTAFDADDDGVINEWEKGQFICAECWEKAHGEPPPAAKLAEEAAAAHLKEQLAEKEAEKKAGKGKGKDVPKTHHEDDSEAPNRAYLRDYLDPSASMLEAIALLLATSDKDRKGGLLPRLCALARGSDGQCVLGALLVLHKLACGPGNPRLLQVYSPYGYSKHGGDVDPAVRPYETETQFTFCLHFAKSKTRWSSVVYICLLLAKSKTDQTAVLSFSAD